MAKLVARWPVDLLQPKRDLEGSRHRRTGRTGDEDRAIKAQESPDGRFLFYKTLTLSRPSPGRAAIWRMPVQGGDPVRIFDFPDPRGEWVVSDRGLYFLNIVPSQHPTFELFDFTTRRTTRLFRLSAPYDNGSGFTVSPDGTWLLYPQRDFTKYEIMLMDVDR